MSKNLIIFLIFLSIITIITPQNSLNLCETQCRGPILTCFSSPLCKEAFEACYPKCHKLSERRMKLDFSCLTGCLNEFESEAKEDVLKCADFCNFRDSFKIRL